MKHEIPFHFIKISGYQEFETLRQSIDLPVITYQDILISYCFSVFNNEQLPGDTAHLYLIISHNAKKTSKFDQNDERASTSMHIDFAGTAV